MIKSLAVLLKLLLTALIVFYISRTYDLSGSLDQIRGLGYVALFLILFLWFLQYLLAAYRFKRILEFNDCKIGFEDAVVSVGIGVFFSNIFINFVGGDLARTYAMRKEKGFEMALNFILADRIFGLFSLVFLVSFSVFYDTRSSESYLYFRLIPIACILLIFFVILVSLTERVYKANVFNRGRLLKLYEIFKKSNYKQIHIYSICCQLFHVLIFFVISKAMAVELPLTSAFYLIPLVLLVSMLPVSFAGWGVREMAVIKILSFQQVTSSQSLSISLCYGITMVLSSLIFYPVSIISKHLFTKGVNKC